MPDPLDRLNLAQQKIDELFGPNYAREHPEVVVVVVQSAASDWVGRTPRAGDRARCRGATGRGGGKQSRTSGGHRARARAGAAVVTPLRSVMNSPLFMCGWPPPGKRKCSVPHRSRLQSCVRPVHAVRRDCWP
jgi:hypothetical protein